MPQEVQACGFVLVLLFILVLGLALTGSGRGSKPPKPMPESDPPIRYLGDMHRLQVKPGDVFVLQYDGGLTKETRDRLQAYWSSLMGDEKLLILDRGMTLGALAKADQIIKPTHPWPRQPD